MTPEITPKQQCKKVTPIQPTTSTKETPSSESEGEDLPLLAPNQMRELVHLETEIEKNTNCTTNDKTTTPGNVDTPLYANLEENLPTTEIPANLEVTTAEILAN